MVAMQAPGHTIQEVALDAEVSVPTIRYWIKKGLLPSPGQGARDGYSEDFIVRAKVIRRWLKLYPRGPFDKLRHDLRGDPYLERYTEAGLW